MSGNEVQSFNCPASLPLALANGFHVQYKLSGFSPINVPFLLFDIGWPIEYDDDRLGVSFVDQVIHEEPLAVGRG
jgi:hypothetical protein